MTMASPENLKRITMPHRRPFGRPAIRPRYGQGRNCFAFTLIEILVVIVIITILLGIGVGVVVFAKGHAKKQNTIATMKIVMNAIDAFHEQNYPDYPDDAPPPNNRFYRYSDGLHGDLFEITYDPPINPTNFYFATESVGKEKLADLDQDVFKVVPVPRPSENDRAVPAFLDGYGKVMLYSPIGGLGGRPVLISAGNDEKFGPGIIYYLDKNGWGWKEDSNNDADSKDNIRSDKVQ